MQIVVISDSITEVFDDFSSISFLPQVQEKFPFDFQLELDGVIVDGNSIFADKSSSDVLIVHLKARSGLMGGKGGFGAQLRSLAKQKGVKKTTNFGACRDLSGRRLRHINDEIILSKWKASKDRGTEFDIEQDTQTGINLWFLSAPTWADSIKIDKRKKFLKTRSKTTLCIDWLRAREEGKVPPKGATIHWGCPRGPTCDFAHGEQDLRKNITTSSSGVSVDNFTNEVQAPNKRELYVQSYLDNIKDDEEIQDMIQSGLMRAKKRPKITHEVPSTLETPTNLPSSEIIPSNEVAMTTQPHVSVSKKLQELVSKEKLASSCGIQIITGSMIIEQVPTQGIVLIGNSLFTTSVYTLATIPNPTATATTTKKECWYYEIELLSDGLMQLGWVSNQFTVPPTALGTSSSSSSGNRNHNHNHNHEDDHNTVGSNGVGDDAHSWAYDGYRQKCFHNSSELAYGPQTGEIWKYGDIIGCYLYLTTTKAEDDASNTTVEIGFAINGAYQGAAYTFPLPSPIITCTAEGEECSEPYEFYPGISLENEESILLNMGAKEFRYPPMNNATTTTAVEGAEQHIETEAITYHRIIPFDPATNNATTSSSSSALPAAPVVETFDDVLDLTTSEFDTIEAYESLGLARLKYELLQRKLKIGGTLQERAKRLFDWRQLQQQPKNPAKKSKKKSSDKK